MAAHPAAAPSPTIPTRGGVPAASQTAAASPDSSSWPGRRLRGACCWPRSWAAARPRPARDAWMSGPALGCSSSSRPCCWRSSGRPAASIWSGSAWTPSACGRSKGDLTGANPSRSGKQGSKLHLAGERGGLPLSVVLSAANANDSTMLETLLEDIPAIRMPTGRRRRGPARCMPTRPTTILAARSICVGEDQAPLARRMMESSARLGRHRWTIERTGAWLGGFRRLRIRYERSSERVYALAMLACAVICFNALQQPPW